MSDNSNHQSLLFRGIYEFEDPSATLVAAKIPAMGTTDLYADTVVVVKPNQSAVFIYKGEVTDFIKSGTYQISTENVPLLTKLASWKFGFESPLRCQLIFFSHHMYTSRRWGSSHPVLVKFDNFDSLVPIRAFGTFNIKLVNPNLFFRQLFGTRSVYSIAELEEFVQNQICELLPEVLGEIKHIEKLNASFDYVSNQLELLLNKKLTSYGFSVSNIQVLSLLPSKEIIEAMDAKSAIQIIGSQKEYLLYKAANSLGQTDAGPSNDPLQMMMGLMLGKGLMGADYHEKEKVAIAKHAAPSAAKFCANCGTGLAGNANFCQSCGKKVL